MIATEELRRLLDERGVEWWEATPCKTKWSSPILGGPVAAREWNGEMVLDTGYTAVTPEQAIAATLGCGMLTADDVRDLIERHSDASGGNGRDFHNGAYVAIADELNATLGQGTCRNVHEPPKDTTFWPAPAFQVLRVRSHLRGDRLRLLLSLVRTGGGERMSRTDIDPATLAASLRRMAGDGSVEWIHEPMQAAVLHDMADLLVENAKLRELVRDMWDFFCVVPDDPHVFKEELDFSVEVWRRMCELGVEVRQ